VSLVCDLSGRYVALTVKAPRQKQAPRLKGLFGVLGMDFYPTSIPAATFATKPQKRRPEGRQTGSRSAWSRRFGGSRLRLAGGLEAQVAGLLET
jgi:hypothetical protein